MSARPLDGIRVLDFSWSVAGPTVTRIMAAHGAEVMKVEWPGHPDPMRTAMFAAESDPSIDNGSFFAGLSIGKESLTLNAGSPEGLEIVKRLIAESDVVVESFSASMLRRWGLDYDAMAAIKPGIIYLSVSGFGHSGPYERFDTWGPTAQAFSGLTALSGFPGREPAGWGYSYMDVCAGYLSTVAMLSALHHRNRTGNGQYIDVAQAEAGIGLTGAAILDAEVNSRSTRRVGFPPGNRAVWPGIAQGNGLRGEVGAPYGLYPTDGGDLEDYCAITVFTDAQWLALVRTAGRPELASDPRFETHAARLRHQIELDEVIGEWTRGIDKHEVMHTLQRAGVPAGAVQNAEEILEEDEQLRERGVFTEMEHPLLGSRRFESVPIRYGSTPISYDALWPVLSSGNDRILRDVAGLTDEQITELNENHITWPQDLPREIPVKRPLW